MSVLLRNASAALQAALAGGVRLWAADLFVFTLAGGTTQYHWTTWDTDLTAEGILYSSKNPWLGRSKWNVVNTLEVPSLTVNLMALNGDFAGGASLKTQIHNGLFDGASFLLSRAFMETPGAPDALGTVDLFGGKVGAIDLIGTEATITVKGKVNDLDQYVPRNLFQIGCNHAFCDAGCTLNRTAYTANFTVGREPSPSPGFIPWGSAPFNPSVYNLGTLAITSGAGAGQRRTIASATAQGLILSYPLYITPAVGDDFTAFQGCDKTFNSGSSQSCTAYKNTQNYRGFEFVPPPNAAW
jgi:uncharacterized phage protein (TIGR02218 family)